MKNTLRTIVILIIAALSISSFANILPENNSGLKYKFKKGDKFTITGKNTSAEIMNVQGNEQNVERNGSFVYDFEVIETGPDFSVLEITFTDRKFVNISPLGEKETDYSAILGKSARFKLAHNGELSDLTGFEDLPLINKKSTVEKALAGYKRSLRSLFFKLPDNAAIGDTWDDSNEVKSGFMGKDSERITKTTYTYKLAEKTTFEGTECYKIEVSFKKKIDASGTHQIGAKISEDSVENGKSTIYFAIEKGMYLSRTSKSLKEGEISMVGAGDFPLSDEKKTELKIQFN